MLQAARALGVDLDSVCGGRGLCGRCQVTVGEGEFAKHGITSRAEHVSAARPGREPLSRAPRPRPRVAGSAARRRSWATSSIDVPAESQVHKQVVRKRAEVRAIELDPVVRLHYVEVAEPDMQRAERRPAAPAGGARASSGSSAELTCDLRSLAEPAEGASPGRVEGHGRGPFGQPDHRGLAGLSRSRLRPRGRRRLDHHRGPSLRSRRAARWSPRPGS